MTSTSQGGSVQTANLFQQKFREARANIFLPALEQIRHSAPMAGINTELLTDEKYSVSGEPFICLFYPFESSLLEPAQKYSDCPHIELRCDSKKQRVHFTIGDGQSGKQSSEKTLNEISADTIQKAVDALFSAIDLPDMRRPM